MGSLVYDATISRELTECEQIENCQHLWPPGWNDPWIKTLQLAAVRERILLDGESYLPSHGKWQRPVDPFIAMRDNDKLSRDEALEQVADCHRLWLIQLKALCALARHTGCEVWVYGILPGHSRNDFLSNPLAYRRDVADSLAVLNGELAKELHSTGGGFIAECYVPRERNEDVWYAQTMVGDQIREKVYAVQSLGYRVMPLIRVTDIAHRPLRDELLRTQVYQCRRAGNWAVWNGPIVPNKGHIYPKITDEQKKILFSPL